MSHSNQHQLPLGPHGGDVESVAQRLGVPVNSILDLSASLNPYPPPIKELVERHVSAISRYSNTTYAEAALAEHLGVNAALVVLTNGGSEAISLVAQLWPEGWVEEPDFSLYARHLRNLHPKGRRWSSNPHSPSGRLVLDPGDRSRAGEILVWDEAYWPMTTGTWTSGAHAYGAVVLGSLTKLWAAPGLRLGYVIAPEESLAQQLRRLQPRWSVGALAEAVMIDALAATDLTVIAARISTAKTDLTKALEARNLLVETHEAPWVLVHETPSWRTKLAHAGVLVRDCSSFGLPNTIRVAIPNTANLKHLLRAVDAVLDSESDR